MSVDLGDLPALSTPKQLSEFLNKSEDALSCDRYFKRGIPYTKIGARIYYLRDDVIAYLLANRVETEAQEAKASQGGETP